MCVFKLAWSFTDVKTKMISVLTDVSINLKTDKKEKIRQCANKLKVTATGGK